MATVWTMWKDDGEEAGGWKVEVRCINRLGDTACRGERERQVVG